MPKLSNNTNRNWFAKTETLLVVSSIGSSVAAIVFQQLAFAAITSIPLSLAISLNSRNRRRLEEVEQQHKASIIQLEQKFSNQQESTDKVLYSLPTRSELLKIEKSLEDYNTTFAEQLNNLGKRQTSVNVELQQIDSDRKKVTELQQRLCVLESILKSHNPTHLSTEIQEALVSVEGKVKKLDRQFNNLPLSDLQSQLNQVQQLVDKLQANSTESTQLNKCHLGEIQYLSQQVQSANGKTQELSLAHTEIRNQLKLLKDLNIEKISSETEFLYTFIDKEFYTSVACIEERIKTLEEQNVHLLFPNLQQRLSQVEQLVNILQKSSKKNPEKKAHINTDKQLDILCEHCHQPIKGGYVMGGYFNNYKFHIDCKCVYEKNHL